MRRISWALTIAAVIGQISVMTANVAAAQSPTDQAVRVTGQVVNVRDADSLQGEVLFQVSRGDMLRLLSRSGNWYFVEDRTGRRGFISRTLVEIVQPAAQPVRPAAAPVAPAAKVPASQPAPQKAEPAQPSPAAQPTEKPTVRAASQPSSGAIDGKRPLGLGLFLSAAPGGAVPSLTYDMSERGTVRAGIGFYTGITGVTGEYLHRFPRPDNPASGLAFEPYVGGGLIFITVSGYDSSVGFMGTGGTFLKFKKIPRWRFSGDFTFVQISMKDVSIAGMGTRTGVHYLF